MIRAFLWVVVFLFTPGVADAAANVFLTFASGSWNAPTTWIRVSGTGTNTYPVAGDTAIISGVTVTVDGGSFAAATVYLSNDGDLQVTSGDTLTIGTCYIIHETSKVEVHGTAVLTGSLLVVDGDVGVDAGGTFDIQGNVALSGGALTVNTGGSVVYTGGTFDLDSLVDLNGGTFKINKGCVTVDAGAIFRMRGGAPRLQVDVGNGFCLPTATSKLEIASNAVIGGTGSVQGGNGAAPIMINVGGGAAADLTLTIEANTTFHGGGTFEKQGYGYTATLDNRGLIKADNGKVIFFGSGMDVITDNGSRCSVKWRIESGAMMIFDVDASLNTSFLIQGVLDDCGVGGLETAGSVSGGGDYGCLVHGTCP